MFEQFFGLSENPFSLTPDPRYIFPSKSHDEALAHLRYWVDHREGFALITGEVGTGKTTALFRLIDGMARKYEISFLTNSTLTSTELLEEICRKFAIEVDRGLTKPALLQRLEGYLVRLQEMGHGAVLIIDEAQNFDHGLLEEVRLLSNLTRPPGPQLLQIALVGQPELERRLASPELRQLKQRIGVHYRIEPLSAEETGQYIHHRVNVAGGFPRVLFPPETVEVLHQITHGLPREINQVASQSLLGAFVDESTAVRPNHVREAVIEMGFKSVLDRSGAPALTVTPSAPVDWRRPAETVAGEAQRPQRPLPDTVAADASRPQVPRPDQPQAVERPRATEARAESRPAPSRTMAAVVTPAPKPARPLGPLTPMVTPGAKFRPGSATWDRMRRFAIGAVMLVILGVAAFLLFAPPSQNQNELAEMTSEATLPKVPHQSPLPEGTGRIPASVVTSPKTAGGAGGGSAPAGQPTPKEPAATPPGGPATARLAGDSAASADNPGAARPKEASAVTAAPMVPSPPVSSAVAAGRLRLQVVSVRDSMDAVQVSQEIQQRTGRPCQIFKDRKNDLTWFAVFLGPFLTQAEAETARAEVAAISSNYRGALIKPIR